jgi:hypothetical protein
MNRNHLISWFRLSKYLSYIKKWRWKYCGTHCPACCCPSGDIKGPKDCCTEDNCCKNKQHKHLAPHTTAWSSCNYSNITDHLHCFRRCQLAKKFWILKYFSERNIRFHYITYILVHIKHLHSRQRYDGNQITMHQTCPKICNLSSDTAYLIHGPRIRHNVMHHLNHSGVL